MNNYVDTYTYDCATRALMEQEGFVFQYYFDSKKAKKAYTEEYDELYSACQKKLYSGGYKIYTTIDMKKQNLLQKAVDDTLASFTEKNDDGTYNMQGAAVSIDNSSGYVVAIVGGRNQDFNNYTLNRAYQSHRQPGSSIKPLLVYTPQLERGYDPNTIVDDHKFEGGPSNASNTYAGKVPLRYAVAHSLNTVAWQLYDELTPKVGLEYLKNMNFTAIEDSDYTLATALGGFTKGVSPLEMASAYATIENDGLYRQPTCIKSIVDSDENVVYDSNLVEKKVYRQAASRMMTDIMTSVMDSGTGRSAKLNGMPCAGKTGTTNDHKDGWFCGFTRYYTTTVWVGCDYPKSISNLSGSTYPAQIWKTYMSSVHENLAPMDFLPYAQLSDDFKNQKASEQEEQDKKREENMTDDENGETKEPEKPEDDAEEEKPKDDQKPSEKPSDSGNTSEKPSEKPGDDTGNTGGEEGGNGDNGENVQPPDDSGDSGETGEDTGNVQ